jgi:sulfatase maturation enzyme AslB (radical SAM superfamily)
VEKKLSTNLRREYPVSNIIAFEPTFRCNLSCAACFYRKKINFPKEIGVNEFIDFLSGINNIRRIVFPGREPLIKDGFFRLLGHVKRRNIPYVLLTNGTSINKNNLKSFIGGHGEDKIFLSLDGDEKIHNAMRGSKTAYARTINAARLLSGKIQLAIVCTISEANLKHLWKLPKIVQEIGHKQIIFEYERKYSQPDIIASQKIAGAEGFSFLKISPSHRPGFSFRELKENIIKMETEAKKYNVTVSYLPQYFREWMADIYYRRLRSKANLICRYAQDMRIDPAGNYIHCFAYRRSFGNIKKEKPAEVYSSSTYRIFRQNLLRHNLMPICETCWGAVPINSHAKDK